MQKERKVTPLVKPLRALYYNPAAVRNLSRVVCPPYDVMDEAQRRRFKKSSPYNFCNILTADKEHDYRRLRDTFLEWIEKRVLIGDTKPCFYLYEQMFDFESHTHRRIGFLGLLRIDREGIIFPHEHTFGAPKKDRYGIIRELKANLSPIFVIMPDKLKVLSASHARCKAKKPFADFDDCSRIHNRVWRIDDARAVAGIQKSFEGRKLFIADGHHRFEVAYRYFKRSKGRYKDSNYILAYFTDSRSGILILPTHRVVRTDIPPGKILDKLSEYFTISRTSRHALKSTLKIPSRQKAISFGLAAGKDHYLLCLKKGGLFDKILEKDSALVYRDLDVYILHKFVLSLFDPGDISYTHSMEEAFALARRNRVSFILRSTPLDTVFAIARKGYKLPQKSTYFYPKLLSGIILRKLDEGAPRPGVRSSPRRK